MNSVITKIYSLDEIKVIKNQWLAAKIFAVNKPLHWTSHDVVKFLKTFLGVKKIGHGGTLDELATGLLIIGIDEKTKELSHFLNHEKSYRATIQLNQKTTTGDLGGEVIATSNHHFSYEQINNVINHFYGLKYDQFPHIYSAVKVNGKKLYEYARKDQSIEITPRKVEIKKITLIEYQPPFVKVDLDVSKGFYVRSFAEDFGEKLNSCACLSQLTRTACAGFYLTAETVNVFDLKKSVKFHKSS